MAELIEFVDGDCFAWPDLYMQHWQLTLMNRVELAVDCI